MTISYFQLEQIVQFREWMEHGVSNNKHKKKQQFFIKFLTDPAQVIQNRLNEFNCHEYYVHYDGLNRRLDQWVQKDRIKVIGQEIDSTTRPTSKKVKAVKIDHQKPAVVNPVIIDENGDRKITRNQKRRHDE